MNRNTLELVLGRYDDPENQIQKDLSYDLYKSNLAIFGLATSGKTTLLKTLLVRLHQVVRITLKERIYILDFSNNLEPYKNLLYTVAYFDASQEENVRRVFQAVEERFTHNIGRLPSGKSYAQCREQERPSHVTFVIDGLNTFLAENRYTSYQEVLLKLARDGLSKGVTVIFTASDTTGGIAKLLTSFGSIIALDFPKDKYTELYNTKIEKPISNPGRGMVNHKGRIYEFQAYFPYNADDPELKDDDAVFIRLLEERLRKCPPPVYIKYTTDEIISHCVGRRMKPFDRELTRDQWEHYTGISWKDYLASPECEDTDLVAGLDYYSLAPVKFNLRTAHAIAIYGRRAFGKTNLLGLILERLLNIPDIRFVVWEDAREGLSRNANTVKSILDAMEKCGRLQEFTKREDFEEYLLTEYYGEFYPAPSSRPNSRSGKDKSESTSGAPLKEPSAILPPEQLNAQAETVMEAAEEEPALSPPVERTYTATSSAFTVFLIQSRLFYETAGMWIFDQFIPRLASFVNTQTSGREKLFIFSDAQPITDNECSVAFDNCLTHVFLLNDIMRYINTRGQKNVFRTLDLEDVKERFGKCALGDGFYYDLERGEIQKLRLLKQLEITKEEGDKRGGDI